MKSVNELRIPAYAVVETTSGVTMKLEGNREDARSLLQQMKREYDEGYKFKIVKLSPAKFIR